jgi:hypothetical protein
LDAFKLVNAEPTPVKALLALFKVRALLYVPATVALGTVPLARLLAFRVVRPAPLPLIVAPPLITTLEENVTLETCVCPAVHTLVELMIPLLPVAASTYALVAASLAALGFVTLLIKWLFMFSAWPCAPTPATLPAVPALMLPGVKLVNPEPTPVKALLALFKVNALL